VLDDSDFQVSSTEVSLVEVPVFKGLVDEVPVDKDEVPVDEDEVPVDEDEVPVDKDEVPVDEEPSNASRACKASLWSIM
jgi:hypothetical protein